MPITEGKAPERRTTARQSATKAAPQTVSSKRETRQASLQEFGDMIALGLMMAKQPADAGALSQHSPEISKELSLIAENDEKVAGFIDRLTTVGPYAGLIKATLPLALQLAVNHARLPADKMVGTMGIIDPAMLEEMVNLKAEQMKAQLESEMAETRKQMAEARAALNGAGHNES